MGLATGYGLAVTWTDVLRPTWWDPMVPGGQWEWILIVPLGAMFYTVFVPRLAWMSRMIFGLFFGIAAGQSFQGFASQYVPQVAKTFKPILPHAAAVGAVSPAQAFNNFLFIVIVICVMTYFFFAFEQNNRIVRNTATTGRWLVMIALGAVFGSTIMTREALLIDRFRFLLFEWLKLDQLQHYFH